MLYYREDHLITQLFHSTRAHALSVEQLEIIFKACYSDIINLWLILVLVSSAYVVAATYFTPLRGDIQATWFNRLLCVLKKIFFTPACNFAISFELRIEAPALF